MDNDFPAALGNGGNSIGFLQQYLRGFNDYQQAGTDIPSRRIQNQYGQESGGPLINQTLISRDPSFKINEPPDIDSPTVDRWIEESTRQRGVPAVSPKTLELFKNFKPVREV